MFSYHACVRDSREVGSKTHRCPSAWSRPVHRARGMPARHHSLSDPQAAAHTRVTQAILLLGSSPASLPNYQVIKKPCESFLKKNVLQKLNLTQSQKHILGFTAQRSRERHRAKNQICSPTRSEAFTAQRDRCAGKDVSSVGRELHRGQDWGFKYQLWHLQLGW